MIMAAKSHIVAETQFRPRSVQFPPRRILPVILSPTPRICLACLTLISVRCLSNVYQLQTHFIRLFLGVLVIGEGAKILGPNENGQDILIIAEYLRVKQYKYATRRAVKHRRWLTLPGLCKDHASHSRYHERLPRH